MANLPRDQIMQKPTASQNAPRVLSAITCSAAGGIADPDEPVSFLKIRGCLNTLVDARHEARHSTPSSRIVLIVSSLRSHIERCASTHLVNTERPRGSTRQSRTRPTFSV